MSPLDDIIKWASAVTSASKSRGGKCIDCGIPKQVPSSTNVFIIKEILSDG